MIRDFIPIVMFGMIPVMAIGVPIALAYARRIDRRSEDDKLTPEMMARFERMEQAIDAIALEVERISEGQRFTTRLLADRGSSAGVGELPLPAMRGEKS